MYHKNNLWGIFYLRGIFALMLGVVAIIVPGIAFSSLVNLLGIYMVGNGIFALVQAQNTNRKLLKGRWVSLYGIFAILSGMFILYNPFATSAGIIFLFASWAFVAGISEAIVALMFRRKTGEGWFISAGILNIFLAVYFSINHSESVGTLAIIFGSYTLAIGIMLVSFSLRFKKKQNQFQFWHMAGK
jgi:uncharacterized membrane protein HdeD (DUF308 family)